MTKDETLRFGTIVVPGEHIAALSISPASGSDRKVVVLPGIHGRTPHILHVGQRLAAHGFDAIVADFYCTAAQRGQLRTPADIGAATEALDHGAIISTVTDLLTTLAAERPVAILGYCVGGAVALQVAARAEGVAAVVAYYGVLRQVPGAADRSDPLSAAAQLNCPVLAHYGTTDIWCPPEDIDELEAKLASSDSAYQVYRYPGAGHAFEESGRPGYRPVAAIESAIRTMTFLTHYMEATS